MVHLIIKNRNNITNVSFMTKERDAFKFESTGRVFYSYIDIIGIGNDLEPKYGYDGNIEVKDENGNLEFDNDLYFVIRPEEKKEPALHMIELWKKFAGIE